MAALALATEPPRLRTTEAPHPITSIFCRGLTHPNLLKYHGVAMEMGSKEGGPAHGGSSASVYIVTEFMNGGDLGTLVSKSGVPLPWKLRARLARDALAGIAALHEHDVVHRDIKTENILVRARARGGWERGRLIRQFAHAPPPPPPPPPP